MNGVLTAERTGCLAGKFYLGKEKAKSTITNFDTRGRR
jgi:hypothetical protein